MSTITGLPVIARLLALAAAVAALATPAMAQYRRYPVSPYSHHRYYHSYGSPDSSYSIIERATEAEQRAPGVTNELAPDAKETATGGPVGGVPGFSGGQ